MKFLIDAMLPPGILDYLNTRGHDAVSPAGLGAQDLPDDALIEIATAEQRVIVTENASDFAQVTTCTVLLVRKSWWSRLTLVSAVGAALDAWARGNPTPGPWPHWLPPELR